MPFGLPDSEMDVAFRRIRKLFKFEEDSPAHYAEMIREYYKGKTMDKRAKHLIKDKFPEYWHQRYIMCHELWKGQLLRRVWRDRKNGRMVTWNVTPEDIRSVVLPIMEDMRVHRIDRDYKPIVKRKQTKLMRPSGMKRSSGSPRY